MNDKSNGYDHQGDAPTPVVSRRPEEEALWRSGRYQPPRENDRAITETELSVVRAHDLDLRLEEFPDGPYGSVRQADEAGTKTPWREGQASISSYRDQNPVDSNRTVPIGEPSPEAPHGSIEGQN